MRQAGLQFDSWKFIEWNVCGMSHVAAVDVATHEPPKNEKEKRSEKKWNTKKSGRA